MQIVSKPIVRESYYETYYDNDLVAEGSFVYCYEIFLKALDDDCAEMFKVTVLEEKVKL